MLRHPELLCLDLRLRQQLWLADVRLLHVWDEVRVCTWRLGGKRRRLVHGVRRQHRGMVRRLLLHCLPRHYRLRSCNFLRSRPFHSCRLGCLQLPLLQLHGLLLAMKELQLIVLSLKLLQLGRCVRGVVYQ